MAVSDGPLAGCVSVERAAVSREWRRRGRRSPPLPLSPPSDPRGHPSGQSYPEAANSTTRPAPERKVLRLRASYEVAEPGGHRAALGENSLGALRPSWPGSARPKLHWARHYPAYRGWPIARRASTVPLRSCVRASRLRRRRQSSADHDRKRGHSDRSLACSPSCAELEQRKQDLEDEKKEIDERKRETSDEGERDALEEQKKEIEEQKQVLDEELRACRR
jgi:hypothetical protein